ncbi:MAG TPA: UvrD-helicase domain-containing protein [Desulfosporosinus sp.]|nr:UvrD-helicase domain-containing protein [Desulfosporosinus sp.]
MSKPDWTVEQLAAISLRGQLLVAAAAGSGKTAVLVERLIQRITDPEEAVDVDRFLVVTFTKAAANEMRERIGKALDNALFQEQVPGEIERLLRQRNLLNRASITTLHSFCLELIRKYFYQLELDPAFRIADQAEADLLRQDVVEDLFETRYESGDLAFLKLVDAFGTDRDDQQLMEHVLHLYAFAYSQPDPDVWLSSLERAYVWADIESLMQSEWGQTVRQGLLDRVSESVNSLERAEQIALRPGGPAPYSGTLQADLNRARLLYSALKEGDWERIEAQFQVAVDYPRLPAVRSKAKKSLEPVIIDESVQKNLQEECKKLRDEAKKKLNSLKDEVFLYPLEQQLPALREMGTMAQTLGALVIEFSQVYAAAKGHRNVLDFTDLEHFALRLLEEEGEASSIAQGLKDYFAEVLVDEYQDINPVQERILQRVSRQGECPNLFMVGDVKQSIYRFRMADPSLFLAKYSALAHWHSGLSASTSFTESVIDLNRNFRSRQEVVEGVNFLFRQIMTIGAGEILYDDRAALQYGASFVSGQDQIRTAEGPIEVHLIDMKGIKDQSVASSSEEKPGQVVEEQSGEDGPASSSAEDAHYTDEELSSRTEDTSSQEDLDKARSEARLVSERIQHMVQGSEFQIYDKSLKTIRPVRYSDIVILMRSYSAVAPIYVEEFQKVDIPVYAETTTGYFGASEVETMLSLLKIIDNPHLDIPLAAVLRSPFVSLNGSELGKIRMMLPEGDFFEALTLAVWAGQNDENLSSEKVNDFQRILVLYEESLPQRLAKAQELLLSAPGLKEKITDFWINLQTWRTRSRHISLANLLWSLYEDTGYLAYVGTMPAGVQRQANLRVLYDRASRFEATRYRGLFRFLRFLDRFQGQGKDMGSARALGENENVVRLITVHASKGLEFPVVFVVGLGRTFNTRSLKGKVLLHSKLGMGMPIIDVENNVRYPSLIQYAVKRRLAHESLAEELRILYVALTRAKERLFLYGTLDNFDNTLLKWQRTSEWAEVTLPEGQLRSATCFLDWIGPALARHPKHLFGEVEGLSALSIPEVNSRWEVQIHRNSALAKEESRAKVLRESKAENVEEGSEKSFVSDLGERIEQAQEKNTDSKQQREDCSEAKSVESWFSEVNCRLTWQYPHLNSVRQIAKTSVSELKRQYNWHANEEAPLLPTLRELTDSMKRPKFLQAARPLNAAERGTALHKAMQHLPFKEWGTGWPSLSQMEQTKIVIEFLSMLEQREILSAEEKSSIQPGKIIQFLGTPLGQRLFSAEQLLREVPFTLTFPSEGQSNILVQGVIDAVIIRADEFQVMSAEILDYKTDSMRTVKIDDTAGSLDITVSANREADLEQILRERYALQLTLYALAIERLLSIRVSDCTLYSFTLGREISISEELRRLIQVPGFPFAAL